MSKRLKKLLVVFRNTDKELRVPLHHPNRGFQSKIMRHHALPRRRPEARAERHPG